MRVIVFGGTGMVGQGVLRECVLDPEVEAVVITETGLWTEDGNSSNLLVVKKSQNVVVKKLTAGAYVRVEMNHHPQRRPNIKHPHSL